MISKSINVLLSLGKSKNNCQASERTKPEEKLYYYKLYHTYTYTFNSNLYQYKNIIYYLPITNPPLLHANSFNASTSTLSLCNILFRLSTLSL